MDTRKNEHAKRLERIQRSLLGLLLATAAAWAWFNNGGTPYFAVLGALGN